MPGVLDKALAAARDAAGDAAITAAHVAKPCAGVGLTRFLHKGPQNRFLQGREAP